MQDNAYQNIIRNLPSSAERKPLFVVGDVHGCAKELSDLILKAKERVSDFQLVLVGDLFTKGPDPVGVFDIIQEHQALCIKGNHDWALWASILQAQKKGPQSLPEHTQQTLHLIRYHKRAIFDLLSALPHVFTTEIVPAKLRKGWESSYPAIIVHAGIDPIKGMIATTERMMLTARYLRWEVTPAGRKLVLVPSGHRAEVLSNRLQSQETKNHADGIVPHNLAYAPSSVVSAPAKLANTLSEAPAPRVIGSSDPKERFRWHELYKGPELVLFGHDAKQGLFRKTLNSGRPICVGLDTGCTYGQTLTGYFPEFDDAIQVAARRKYFDLIRNVILLKSITPRVAV